MPVAGPVADRVRGLIPVTWDALSRDPRVGDGPLQAAINLAKETVTGTVVPSTQEQNYPLIAIDYIAKVAVIEIIPGGIDFWMNQAQSVSASGTNENLSYTDRASRLDQQRQELLEETRTKYTEVAKLIGYWLDNGRAVPQMSSANINPFHLTPSPEEFPRPYKQTQYS
jgi:hypothetical protein